VHGGGVLVCWPFVIDFAAHRAGSAMLGHLQMDSMDLAGDFCTAEYTEDIAVTEPSVGINEVVSERVEVRTTDRFHCSLG
jgi:hypothetical protein